MGLAGIQPHTSDSTCANLNGASFCASTMALGRVVRRFREYWCLRACLVGILFVWSLGVVEVAGSFSEISLHLWAWTEKWLASDLGTAKLGKMGV